MSEIGKWNGHSFEISSSVVRGFTGLTVKGGSDTEDKTSSSQKYVSRKNAGLMEVSLTVALNALTGCSVRDEAMAFVEDARSGAKDYFYVGGKKLTACQLMLTEASVDEVEIAPGGVWTQCQVKLTMKQCSKIDGSSTDSSSKKSKSSKKKSGSSKKKSVKTTSTTTTSRGIMGNIVAGKKTTGALNRALAASKSVNAKGKSSSKSKKGKSSKTTKTKKNNWRTNRLK